MGDRQADEADRTRGGDGGAGDEDDQDRADDASPVRLHAETARGVIAETQDVELVTEEDAGDGTAEQDGATVQKVSRSRPVTDPANQKRTTSIVSLSRRSKALVQAPSYDETTTPASANLTGVAPSRPKAPIAKTNAEAARAPRKANQTYW